MPELRFRYEKLGKAAYISHLDTLRTFQRAFLRAGITLKHSEGFNPHPRISIAMPLQLGCESVCEALDAVILDGPGELCEPLNRALPEGLHVLFAAGPEQPVGNIAYAEWALRFASAGEAVAAAAALQAAKTLPVEKKTKRGLSMLDLAPHLQIQERSGHLLCVLLRANAPTVNTGDLCRALASLSAPLPQSCCRLQFFNGEGEIFS